MENASKALVMAGGMLIALMIISALILMFSNLSAYQQTRVVDKRAAQVVEFNSQYETYNRTDVRGNELLSLLNRAIDYNRRKSTVGVGEEGESIGYEPIKITFEFDKTKVIAPDVSNNQLFTTNKYTVSGNSNEFEKNIKEKIDSIENKYGKESLEKIAVVIGKTFIASTASQNEKDEAVKTFNQLCSKRTVTWSDIQPGSTTRTEIYKYYEFIQFKRMHFDCISEEGTVGSSGVEYDKNTGRIIAMNFNFNGKIE